MEENDPTLSNLEPLVEGRPAVRPARLDSLFERAANLSFTDLVLHIAEYQGAREY